MSKTKKASWEWLYMLNNPELWKWGSTDLVLPHLRANTPSPAAPVTGTGEQPAADFGRDTSLWYRRGNEWQVEKNTQNEASLNSELSLRHGSEFFEL